MKNHPDSLSKKQARIQVSNLLKKHVALLKRDLLATRDSMYLPLDTQKISLFQQPQSLPSEILEIILEYLPLNTMLSLRQTCRYFYTALAQSNTWQQYYAAPKPSFSRVLTNTDYR